VSSTRSFAASSERDAAVRAAWRLAHEVSRSEDFGASPQSPWEAFNHSVRLERTMGGLPWLFGTRRVPSRPSRSGLERFQQLVGGPTADMPRSQTSDPPRGLPIADGRRCEVRLLSISPHSLGGRDETRMRSRGYPRGIGTAVPSMVLASNEIPITDRIVGRMSTERISTLGVAPASRPGPAKMIGMFCTCCWCPPWSP
jgi:hypothetical protein